MRPLSLRPILVGLWISLSPSLLFAGTFRMADVAYTVWPLEFNDDQIRVLVTATAVYKGKLDLIDVDAGWIINTHLNTSLAPNLYDWEFPEWTGVGNVGKGIPYSGFVITCGLAEGVDAAVDKCDSQNNSLTYLGHGAAAVYHNINPEIDELLARTEQTECLTYEVGGGVSGLPRNPDKPLILQNNGGDDLAISGDGGFVFPTELRDHDTYDVTVFQRPFGVRCLVISGTGTIDGQDVTDIVVYCVNYCEARYSTIDYPADFEAAGAPQCVTASLYDNGDGTVTDINNGLLWTKGVVYGTGGTGYYSGTVYCEGLVLDGFDDWRVPDVAQLQTLLPVGTCDTALDGCWSDVTPYPDIEESGIHWSRSTPPLLTYCPPGFGCRAHKWTVGLGPGELWGGQECWSGIGCRDPERVWWRETLEYHLVRCVAPVH